MMGRLAVEGGKARGQGKEKGLVGQDLE